MKLREDGTDFTMTFTEKDGVTFVVNGAEFNKASFKHTNEWGVHTFSFRCNGKTYKKVIQPKVVNEYFGILYNEPKVVNLTVDGSKLISLELGEFLCNKL